LISLVLVPICRFVLFLCGLFCLARPTFWSFSSGSDVRILSRELLAFQVVSMEVISVGFFFFFQKGIY
jgi:hypothetical protein